jgi:protocatechuate 3,4-dioxygenase beta subunit
MTYTHSSDTDKRVEKRANRRRGIVRFGLGLVAAGGILAASLAPGVLAQTLLPSQTSIVTTSTTRTTAAAAATAQMTVGTTETLTVAQTEGPYFKTNSPERTSLVDDTTQGTVLTITGQVLAADGTPVANALVDFWQANASGAYDNSGYNLRGHQYTDANGYYTLATVVPGLYPGRTRHIHVKVQAPNGPMLTTQLYFPGEARNSTDGIFDPSLVLNITDNGDGTQAATFNFVVNAA